MTTKYSVANDVAAAVQAIETIKGKITNLDAFARTLVEGKFQHVEIAMEETNPDYPPKIQPLFPQNVNPNVNPDLDPDEIPKQVLPIGYMKVYPATTGPITTYITTIPIDIGLALVDTLMTRMKQDMEGYHKTINKSIESQSDDKPKKYSYNIPVKDLK